MQDNDPTCTHPIVGPTGRQSSRANRRVRQGVAIGAVALLLCSLGASAASTDAVTASEPAQRVGPVGDRCDSAVVVGDSLTAIHPDATTDAFAAAGIPVVVEARSARRIPDDVERPLSGVLAIRDLLLAGIDADCWVIGLGSNDLLWVTRPGRYGTTGEETTEFYIDAIIDELPNRRLWWINLDHLGRPEESALMNELLDRRAATSPQFSVIDWFTTSSANRGWFIDDVHVTNTGYAARGQLVAGDIAAAGVAGQRVDQPIPADG